MNIVVILMFSININELRHPITIQRSTIGKDEDRRPIEVFKDLFSTRAKILNVRGSEYYEAHGNGLDIEKTFYIRFRHDIEISNKDRVYYNNKFYEIIYLNDVEERHEWLEIKAKRTV